MHNWTRRIVVAATLISGCGVADTEGRSVSKSGGPNRIGIGAAAAGGASGKGAVSCAQVVPATSQLPRLTRAQYDNTIRDLLGIDGQPSSMLAPDSTGSVDQRAWDGYQAAAESVAAQVFANANAISQVMPCAPTGDGSACARQFVETFGRRAFRRPLTTEEVSRFEALFTNRAQLTANGTFDEAAQLAVRAFLVSPSFLTRAEIAQMPEGSHFVLSSYEVASRLSYMLWRSMPDDELFAAAETNALSTSQGILAQAQRMLEDPSARAMASAFHEQYAHMGEGTRWSAIQRDPVLYGAFTPAMVPLLSQETNRFFDHVVFDMGGTFRDLITSPVGFVNATLAPLYGLDATKYGEELVAVQLDPATRSGVFTRAGFLTAYSLFYRPSAILRGAFIQKEVLCTEIGAPPPGAEATPLPMTAGLSTNRERTDAQTAGPVCAGCHHSLINPTGFALEAYDAIGSVQKMERGSGAAINTAAKVLVGATAVDVTGPVDMMEKIATAPEAQRCYAKKWVQYAYGRTPTGEESCTVDALASNLTQDGYTVVDLITDLTQTPSFRYRAVEVAP